jgi:hypothetical protein
MARAFRVGHGRDSEIWFCGDIGVNKFRETFYFILS